MCSKELDTADIVREGDFSPVAIQHGQPGITKDCDWRHIAKVRQRYPFTVVARADENLAENCTFKMTSCAG